MEKKLNIVGMSCAHCVKHVTDALSEDIEGIVVKEVSLEGGYALVDFERDIDENEIKSLIEELGFELTSIE
ncbi:MAG: heavy-metal-associated domain-containing protein [Clostridioides sp.]|jgi:copper chaperone CopZ|nr:heavy-metal-associated domain-containing protein [Clostridioides sp.]